MAWIRMSPVSLAPPIKLVPRLSLIESPLPFVCPVREIFAEPPDWIVPPLMRMPWLSPPALFAVALIVMSPVTDCTVAFSRWKP